MLKVGDRVAIKFGTKGRNKIYNYAKIIGFDSNIKDPRIIMVEYDDGGRFWKWKENICYMTVICA
jgi:hypothetical protein